VIWTCSRRNVPALEATRALNATRAAGSCWSVDATRLSWRNFVTTSLRIASITGALALALTTAAAAATVRLAPLAGSTVGATLSGCSAPASITFAAPADVPAIAAGQHATGIATVRVELDGRGGLSTASVLESSGNRWLDRAALGSARSSRYAPEVRGCEHVGGAYAFVVDFTQ
jgi:TonB family protein